MLDGYPKSPRTYKRERNNALILVRSRSLNRLYICVAANVHTGLARLRRAAVNPIDLEIFAWAPRMGIHAATLRFRLRKMHVAGKPMSPRAWYGPDAVALVRDNVDGVLGGHDTSDVLPNLSLVGWIARLVSESQEGTAEWLQGDFKLRPAPTMPIGVIAGTQVVHEAPMSPEPEIHTDDHQIPTEPEKGIQNGDVFPAEAKKPKPPRWLLALASGARITR